MLPKAFRLALRANPEFFQKAQRTATRHWLVYVVKNSLIQTSQGSVVVPKKIAKTAVVRNLLKRQARAALIPILQSKPGYQIVLLLRSMPRGGSLTRSKDWQAEILSAISKL